MKLKITDLVAGTGPMAFGTKAVAVHYEGWLFDASAPEGKGRAFDSSRSRGEAYRFQLGSGQVIPGWNRGVAGMRVGGRRRLVIPPELAYGPRGAEDVIPPNATLVFDIELLEAA